MNIDMNVIGSVDSIFHNYTTTEHLVANLASLYMEMPDKKKLITKYVTLLLKSNIHYMQRFGNDIGDIITMLNNLDDYDDCVELNEAFGMNDRGKSALSVELDADGSILIKKHESVNFKQIYNNSHRLLKIYSDAKDINGLKYELALMWYMLTILENRIIYNKSFIKEKLFKDRKKEAIEVRAFILSDFNKYMKEVLKLDKTFNFYEYYKTTPFYINTYKIDKRLVKLIL